MKYAGWPSMTVRLFVLSGLFVVLASLGCSSAQLVKDGGSPGSGGTATGGQGSGGGGGGGGTRGSLGWGCALDSDCAVGLVCTFGLCHGACVLNGDCPANELCVESGTGASGGMNVCQLPQELKCLYNSDCGLPLVCARDEQCRGQCQTTLDCVSPQVCTTSMVCALPSQLAPGTNDVPGVTSGAVGSGAGGAGGAAGAAGAGGAGDATS